MAIQSCREGSTNNNGSTINAGDIIIGQTKEGSKIIGRDKTANSVTGGSQADSFVHTGNKIVKHTEKG